MTVDSPSRVHPSTETGRCGRALAPAGAVVAVAAVVGWVAPWVSPALAGPMDKPATVMARVLAHPDAALVASSRTLAWTTVSLAVCLLLARRARLSIYRALGPAALLATIVDARPGIRRRFIRAYRAGGRCGP